ncbi:MAG: response regulator [Proteobacteria bacterium]|jgi:two-component system phosphate regulon response regulator PhoB|nr:response regulator [Pseudomonadota bacterium]|tara:strand:+ start:362 stop:1060 length:699 start_codon:yes stop_codon:yes gene_type:complete
MIKILIADDEPNQLELMAFNLENAGFSVIRAQNGKEALQFTEDHNPDLIIIDWMMPNMSGIDVCRILRSRTDTKLLPIIILSARSEEGDKSLGLDTGADDYISKPFSPKELISRVKALLRRSRPSLINDILEYNNLKLSLSEMIVTFENKPIKLGPKEFKLLTVLMERPGHVFSRTKLLDLVWGHGVYVEERTIDVHMSRLRKAIKSASGDKNIIRTVRDGGYGLFNNQVDL